jgi:hypothetical protein
MRAEGVLFTMPPKKPDFGGVLANLSIPKCAYCSVGAEAA